MGTVRQQVFISYSHRDREWLDRLEVHLRPLQLDEPLQFWDDRRITVGGNWLEEIKAALDRTRVAVLLISADFLASDFISRVELPALLQAAAREGTVVMPLIISPSRFASVPSLGELQALNDPARPLIALSRSDQEAVLVGVADAVQSAMALAGIPLSTDQPALSAASAVDHIPLAACLARLGCSEEHVEEATTFATDWLVRRSGEHRYSAGTPDLGAFLLKLGACRTLAHDAQAFCDQILSWCAPRHLRSAHFYISVKKVSEAHRQLVGLPTTQAETASDKLVKVHSSLLRQRRLGFLPARLLLGQDLPARDDEVFFFRGSFRLDLAEAELGRVPGALETLASAPRRDLYGVMSTVFQNPDPFVYPLLTWEGTLGERPVTILLSRQYIGFDSITATALVEALRGSLMCLDGLGTLSNRSGTRVLQPWCCSINL